MHRIVLGLCLFATACSEGAAVTTTAPAETVVATTTPSSVPPTTVPGDPEVTLEAVATVVGDQVVVEVSVSGFEVEFVRGDDSGETAHVHAYVDRPPPAAGDEVPLGDPTIVHSLGSTITLEGLESGPHEVWVVAADGNDNALIPPEPFKLTVVVP